MSERSQLKFAVAAFAAGLAWGYLRHRDSTRRGLLAVLQALEWFVAYGGAAAVIGQLRAAMEPIEPDSLDAERITHFRQVVTERTGTEG